MKNSISDVEFKNLRLPNRLNICLPGVVDPSHHTKQEKKNPFQSHHSRGDLGLCSEQVAAQDKQPSVNGPKYSKLDEAIF